MAALPAYRNVVVPIDSSARAGQALPHAYALAAEGGTIHLLHVLELPEPPNPMYAHYTQTHATPEDRARLRMEAEEGLEVLVRSSPAPGGVHVQNHVLEERAANVAERICRAADELGADIVCMASHGRRGLKRVLLGSVAEGVLRRCRVPTLVVRVPEHDLAED